MKVILQGVVGSTAYGLATPLSDVDRLGVYVAPTELVLGLGVANVVKNTLVSTEPDIQLHEVGKYLSLALQGNPTILELLYLEEYDVCGDRNPLVENRTQFLSKHLAARYGGYVMQQLYRLEGREKAGKKGFASDLAKRSAKHGRHCYRLLIQGAQLLENAHMVVRLTPEQREECFAAGELAENDTVKFRAYIEDKMKWFDEIAENSVLPDEPDRESTEFLLKMLRIDGFEDPYTRGLLAPSGWVSFTER